MNTKCKIKQLNKREQFSYYLTGHELTVQYSLVNCAGHQHCIGSPTYWAELTSRVKKARTPTVHRWLILSAQSSSLLPWILDQLAKPYRDSAIVLWKVQQLHTLHCKIRRGHSQT